MDLCAWEGLIMTTTTTPPIRLTSDKLEKLAPGLYVDETGKEYFYMAALYPHIAQRMMEEPELYTPGFIVRIVENIREFLHWHRMELMD